VYTGPTSGNHPPRYSASLTIIIPPPHWPASSPLAEMGPNLIATGPGLYPGIGIR
jgi:hypothetical protein